MGLLLPLQTTQYSCRSRTVKMTTPNLPHGRHSRIGIIGGGPSGIAAAYFLMKKGYYNVTVLERSEDVGGKCETIPITDSEGKTRLFELGAEWITYAYDLLYEFCEEVGAEWREAGLIVSMLGDGKLGRSTRVEPWWKTLPAVWRYLLKTWEYRDIVSRPGNEGLTAYPELVMSSDEFIKKNRLEALRGVFITEQFGYGESENFPAIHLLKTIPITTLSRVIGQEIPFLKPLFTRPIGGMVVNGTQNLFRDLAALLETWKQKVVHDEPAVITRENVVKMEGSRSGPVVVKTESKEYKFDKVICSAPLPMIADMMKLPTDTDKLFRKMKFHPYVTGHIEVDRYVPKHYYQNLEEGKDEPVQLNKRWDESRVLMYGYNWRNAENIKGNEEHFDEVMKRYLKKKLLIEEYTKTPEWRLWDTYHPYVSLEEFQSGFFDRVEEKQGEEGVYFTGGGMAAESLEYSCRYSRNLIDRFFP